VPVLFCLVEEIKLKARLGEYRDVDDDRRGASTQPETRVP
jgi:hypothetical protein